MDYTAGIGVLQYRRVDIRRTPDRLRCNIAVGRAVGSGFNRLPLRIVINVIDRARRNAIAAERIGFSDTVLSRVIRVLGDDFPGGGTPILRTGPSQFSMRIGQRHPPARSRW